MTAVVIHAAHDLRVEPHEAPDPGPGEVRIRIGRGGICGSDLHYYHAGGFGAVRVRQPMVLGHEAAGVVEAARAVKLPLGLSVERAAFAEPLSVCLHEIGRAHV